VSVGQAGHKSLFGSFSSEKEQILLFLKKKQQKDFCFLRSLTWGV
jgi:hypothetical protein